MTKPTILISPAMAVPARVYGTLVDELRDAGFDTQVVPRRGFEPDDLPPSADNDWSYADEADDLARAVGLLAEQSTEPGERREILVLGHSLGAQLAAVLLSDPANPAGARIDGLVTVAGSVPHVDNYPPGNLVGGIAEEVLAKTATEDHWPAPGFGAPGAKTLMRQWAEMVLHDGLPDLVDAGLPITTPTLAIRLDGDAFVSGAAAQAFEVLIAPAARTDWTYGPDDCPPDGSLDHVRWVKTPRPVVERVRAWWDETRS